VKAGDVEDWSRARHVLCVRLDAMGDVLMTTPAIRALRESGPADRRLTLLTSASGAAVARLVPQLDDVLVYEAPWVKNARDAASCANGDLQMAEQLRSRGFDAAVIFTVYTQNPLPAALLCFYAGIPLRLAHARENPYLLLSNWVPEPEPHSIIRHEVRRQLDLVASVGCRSANESLTMRVSARAQLAVHRKAARAGIAARVPWIVVHAGASAPSRRYPPESFALAAQGIARVTGCHLIFTGSAAEAPLIEGIRTRMNAPSVSLAGRLSLEEFGALLSLSAVLVSNNTGAVHVAAAVGAPVVDIYALTNPQHTPWQVPHRVLSHDVPCKFCYKSLCPQGHHECLRGLAPGEVVQAVQELLAQLEDETHEHSRSQCGLS
jgi:lipopolysaccharide heptosyltransferase II